VDTTLVSQNWTYVDTTLVSQNWAVKTMLPNTCYCNKNSNKLFHYISVYVKSL